MADIKPISEVKILRHVVNHTGTESFVKQDGEHIYKEVIYPKTSKMVQYGIDSLIINDSKTLGKKIDFYQNGEKIGSVATKSKESIEQFREYLKAIQIALSKGFKRG